jgi:GTPase-activating protein SST2
VNLHHGDRASVEDGSADGTPKTGIEAADAKIHRRISMAEKLNEATEKKGNVKSNTDRLKYILEEPSYRALFRDFLKANFCEENLSFWLDVEDFKRKFNTTSSAQAAAPARLGNRATPGQAAMEKHHDALIHTAFQIYNKYLAPSSQNELNIDHGLRLDLANYLGEVMNGLHGKSFDGQVDTSQAVSFNATQLQVLIKLYTRIQTHVLRLMAMDSLPKVCFFYCRVETFSFLCDECVCSSLKHSRSRMHGSGWEKEMHQAMTYSFSPVLLLLLASVLRLRRLVERTSLCL